MRKFKRHIAIIMIISGAILISVSLLECTRYIRDAETSDEGNKIAASFVAPPPEYIDHTEKEAIDPEDLMDLYAMREVNEDTVGYLKIQDKELPVVRAEDPSKYLKTGWDGKRTACGTIFMDPGTNEESKNRILYGHHMKNGRMFGTLDKYLQEDYEKEHETFRYIDDTYVDTYKISAVIRISVKDMGNIIDMDLVDDIEKLNKEAEKNGKLYSTLHTGKTYMTCVTCEYTRKNGRLLVIGERIQHIKRPDAS